MSENRIMSGFIGRFIIQSLLVIGMGFATIRVGQLTGTRFLSLDVPYAGRIGFVVGATLTIAVFAMLRWGYHTYRNDE